MQIQKSHRKFIDDTTCECVCFFCFFSTIFFFFLLSVLPHFMHCVFQRLPFHLIPFFAWFSTVRCSLASDLYAYILFFFCFFLFDFPSFLKCHYDWMGSITVMIIGNQWYNSRFFSLYLPPTRDIIWNRQARLLLLLLDKNKFVGLIIHVFAIAVYSFINRRISNECNTKMILC